MAHFLIVEDERELAMSFARIVRPFGEVEVVGTFAQAIAAIDVQPLLAALVDQVLPDGWGLDVVAHLRRRWPAVPALVLTASRDLSLVNRAQALRAEFVFKPAGRENIVPFVQSAVAIAGGAAARLALAVRRLAAMTCLRRREVEILNLALAGVPKQAMAKELGMTENTLKSTTRRLLERTGEPSLQDLARSVFEMALHLGVP